MRIAFLGDSLTWGGYGGNFVDIVAELMPQHEIINAGVGGNTVVNLMRRVDEVIALEPDVIFVMVGGNDTVSYLYPQVRGYYRKSQKLEDGFVSPELYESTYRDLLFHIQSQYIHPIVGIAPTEYNQELIEARKEYNTIARDVAASMNIPVLDFTEHFPTDNVPDMPPVNLKFIQQIGDRGASGWDDFEAEQQRLGYNFTFDGMHLTPQSAKQFANLIAEFLQNHV